MRHKENGRGLSTLISLAFSSPQLLYSEIKRHLLIGHNSPEGILCVSGDERRESEMSAFHAQES